MMKITIGTVYTFGICLIIFVFIVLLFVGLGIDAWEEVEAVEKCEELSGCAYFKCRSEVDGSIPLFNRWSDKYEKCLLEEIANK